MPVDMTFEPTHILTANDNDVEIRLPVVFESTVRDRDPANIAVANPVDGLRKTFLHAGTTDYITLCVPYGDMGTMTVQGTGTILSSSTGAYDTINSGSAVLLYDFRRPEIVFEDIPATYSVGGACDYIVGYNRSVTFDVANPGNAEEVFMHEGVNLGSNPQMYAYLGSVDPRLPLPDDLDADPNWELMRRHTYATYFAVRFAQVPTGASGALNISERVSPTTLDAGDLVLAVSAPLPQPQPQMQNVPIIGKIDTQFLTLTEDFSVTVPITGGTADTAKVRGLANGSAYTFDETNQQIIISGNANKLITDATWACTASGPGGDAALVNQTYNYVELTPVITQLGKQTIYTDEYLDLFVPVANVPSDGTVTMELVGLDHEIADMNGDEVLDSMRLFGAPLSRNNFSITEGRVDIMVTNTGGDASGFFEYDLLAGAPVIAFNNNNTTPTMYLIGTNGSLSWTNTDLVPRPYDAPVAALGGGVFIFSDSPDHVNKIGPDGSQEWTYRLPSFQTYSSIVASSNGGVFAFRDDTDDVYKIGSDGSLEWTYTALPTAGYGGIVASSDGGVFAFNDSTYDVYKIGSDGTLAWTNTDLPVVNRNDVVASSDGGVFAFSDNNDNVYKIGSDGSLDWTYTALPNSTYDPPVASSDGGVFLFNIFGRDVYKIGSDGSLDWTNTDLPNINQDELVASSDGGVFAFNDANDDVYKIGSDGTLDWTYTALPNATYDELVAAADGGVFVLNDANDDVYKIGSDGTLAWTNIELPNGFNYTIVTIPVIF